MDKRTFRVPVRLLVEGTLSLTTRGPRGARTAALGIVSSRNTSVLQRLSEVEIVDFDVADRRTIKERTDA